MWCLERHPLAPMMKRACMVRTRVHHATGEPCACVRDFRYVRACSALQHAHACTLACTIIHLWLLLGALLASCSAGGGRVRDRRNLCVEGGLRQLAAHLRGAGAAAPHAVRSQHYRSCRRRGRSRPRRSSGGRGGAGGAPASACTSAAQQACCSQVSAISGDVEVGAGG